MTHEPGKNSAASIRARLLTLAQSKGEDYQRMLGRYAIERFLYHLGRSPYVYCDLDAPRELDIEFIGIVSAL